MSLTNRFRSAPSTQLNNVAATPDHEHEPLLGVPAQSSPSSPSNPGLPSLSPTLSIDAALAMFADDSTLPPLAWKTDDGFITVVPLPFCDKGRAALVVYANGQTLRYENLTRLSNGVVVATVRGRIIELFPS